MIGSSRTWPSIILFFIIAVNSKGLNLEKNGTICKTNFCQRAAENLKESINPSVDPCENFYDFACGNWGTKHKAKTLFLSTSTLSDRTDVNTKNLAEYLSKNNSDEEPKAVHKARQLFSSCLDTATLDKNGLEPLHSILRRLGLNLNSTDEFDLLYTLVKAQRIVGKDFFFSLGVAPDPYNRTINRISIVQPEDDDSSTIPSLVSKLDEDQSYGSINLREYISSALNATCKNIPTEKCQLLTDTRINDVVIDYTSAISEVTSKVYSDNGNKPHIVTLAELQNLTDAVALANNISSSLNWTRLIELTFENTTLINWTTFDPKQLTIVAEMIYLKDMLPILLKLPSKQHEIGLTWKMIDHLAYYSASPIRNLKQNYSWELQYKTRQEWCALTVSQVMSRAVSYYYTTTESSNFIKAEVEKIVQYVHDAFRDVIQSTLWMDEITKSKAINKTDAMKKHVSFPSALTDKKRVDDFYADFKITDHFLETVIINSEKTITSVLHSLNTTNDITKDRGNITPVMVNAFYDSEQNTISIPAGILEFPLCANGIQALNYGAIGSIVGHEITHGFDTKGRLYNNVGNLEKWWDNMSLNEFQKKTQCFKEVYSKYSYEQEGITVSANGELTLPENIADNGGFKSALFSYRKYLSENSEPLLPHFENYTHEQLFTLGFAQVWCEQPTLVTAFLSSAQEHSPNIIRVNGVLMNSKEFPQIWHCSKGSKMNPPEKCELW